MQSLESWRPRHFGSRDWALVFVCVWLSLGRHFILDSDVVTGGFAEIGGQGGVSVLAERAVARADMTQEQMDSMVAEAHAVYTRAKDNWENEPGPVDDAAKLLSDMVAVGDHIGLSSKQPNL